MPDSIAPANNVNPLPVVSPRMEAGLLAAAALGLVFVLPKKARIPAVIGLGGAFLWYAKKASAAFHD